MLTGTDPREFEQTMGPAPYSDLHFYTYALKHGYLCGFGFVQPQIVADTVVTQLKLTESPAYVVVATPNPGVTHAVLWNGRQIFDPDPLTDHGKPLTHYQILLWVPIYRV